MCRLFAFSFHKATPKHRRISVVDSFRALSLHGAVLPTSAAGHGDGWGMVVYGSLEKNLQKYKSVTSAHIDDECKIESLLADDARQSGLIHLRKKTVGDTLLQNTHPFIHSSYSFIHNGTVSHSDAFSSVAHQCEGSTDSERLFRKFLEIKSKRNCSVSEAFIEMLLETKQTYPEHSALNTILHDGEQLYVSRSINMNNNHFEENDLLSYYTLYVGETPTGDIFVSSEILPDTKATYTLLPNHSVTSISLLDNSIHTVALV